MFSQVSVCPPAGGVGEGGVCNTQTDTPADTTGYGQQEGGTHPTGMHSCSRMPTPDFLQPGFIENKFEHMGVRVRVGYTVSFKLNNFEHV